MSFSIEIYLFDSQNKWGGQKLFANGKAFNRNVPFSSVSKSFFCRRMMLKFALLGILCFFEVSPQQSRIVANFATTDGEVVVMKYAGYSELELLWGVERAFGYTLCILRAVENVNPGAS